MNKHIEDIQHALELTLLAIIDLTERRTPRPTRIRTSETAIPGPHGPRMMQLADPELRPFASETIVLRWIGKRLNEIGGIETMQSAIDNVADLYSIRGKRMQSIATCAWDGIGDWQS
jgi:hypothetical protein